MEGSRLLGYSPGMSFRHVVAAVVLFSLAACGEEAGNGVPLTVVTGQLIGGTGEYPGAIKGVHFRSRSQSGFTDGDGTFRYVEGETVTFGVADVDFRTVHGAAMVSPWQLAATGQCAESDELTRLLVLLFSLDGDGDASNGTDVPNVAPSARQRSLATLSDGDVTALIDRLFPGRSLIDGDSAIDRFITQMDGEIWQQIGIEEFPLTVGLVRSQGVTTDGSSWFFSWKLGLEKTDLDYVTQLSVTTTAIPPDLAVLGDNHIGDIDFWNGMIYAPIEDGPSYRHPHIVLFDPATLMAGQEHALSDTPLTKGVPWVSVDAARGHAYVAEWDPTPQIFVLDLTTLAFQGAIPLHRTIGRIQGTKVFEGSLYAASDDDAKDIYKINLDTGTVIPLFAFHQPFEQEGLVFLDRPDGSLLHTLNVSNPVRGTQLRHHQRVRAPLRQDVCASR